MRTELSIPFPPSVNAMYGPRKGGGVRKTKRYTSWIKSAGTHLLTQKQSKHQHDGQVVITLLFNKPDNRRRDIDNLNKATLDLLVRHQIIKDDSLVSMLHNAWADQVKEGLVIIEDVNGSPQ